MVRTGASEVEICSSRKVRELNSEEVYARRTVTSILNLDGRREEWAILCHRRKGLPMPGLKPSRYKIDVLGSSGARGIDDYGVDYGKFVTGGGENRRDVFACGAGAFGDYVDWGVEDAFGWDDPRSVCGGAAALWRESRAGVGREARRRRVTSGRGVASDWALAEQ